MINRFAMEVCVNMETSVPFCRMACQ
ncbi:hypothetical protein BN2475_570066 [Paraburkholderia ribeironis]|uniref:Uncharacterized protein n=1 Tax=Paraburkholderia ribeironis TaxID=1247936 RepID=A0A1N7SE19_9BURK|nr:hypothetical protein BN2475_570066 [Paraburkholderia ribeironis]